MRRRRSTRSFKPDPIPDEYIEKILEAGRWAMSGANAQPWEFVVVKDKAMREKLAELYANSERKDTVELEMHLLEELRQPIIYAAQDPPGFKDAPAIIVVCGDRRTVQCTVVSGWLFNGPLVLHRNLANCAHNMHLAATALGLGAQWVSLTLPHMGDFAALLGVPKYFTIDFLIPVGYPAYDPGRGYRRKLSEMVHWGKYDMSKFRSNADITAWMTRLRKMMRRRYPLASEVEKQQARQAQK